MKQIILFILTTYQVFFSVIVKQVLGIPASCRYSPTCSAYMTEAIRTEGIVKGGLNGLKRLMTCHPFARTYGAV